MSRLHTTHRQANAGLGGPIKTINFEANLIESVLHHFSFVAGAAKAIYVVVGFGATVQQTTTPTSYFIYLLSHEMFDIELFRLGLLVLGTIGCLELPQAATKMSIPSIASRRIRRG